MQRSLAQLEAQRQHLLQQMAALDRLRCGSLSRQFFPRPGAHPKPRQGPYYVLHGYRQGRPVSQRVPAVQVPQLQRWIANYRRFRKLARQLVQVTDQLTRRTPTPTPAPQTRTPPPRP